MASRVLHVATAGDDPYSMPIAVAVRSLLENLDAQYRVELSVLSDRISPSSQRRCELSWRGFPVSVRWIEPNREDLSGVPVESLLPVSSYFRLLIPRLVPDAERILYLDPDTLVRRSVHPLYEVEMGTSVIAAAQDTSCPRIHFRSSLPHYKIASRYLLNQDPVPNYQQLQIPADAPYFNAGVLVMDLEKWRNESLSEHLINFTRANFEFNVSADQYSLNAFLWNRWCHVDARWNQLQSIFGFPSWEESIFDQASYINLIEDPWIMHFAGRGKPWLPNCQHPFVDEFLSVLDRTDWAGYRPVDTTITSSRRIRNSWRWLRDSIRVRVRRWTYRLSETQPRSNSWRAQLHA